MGGGVQKTLPMHTANHWPMHQFATPSAANCSVLFPLPLPGLAATYQVSCESSGGVDFLLAELPASEPVWFFDSLFVCLSVFEQQKISSWEKSLKEIRVSLVETRQLAWITVLCPTSLFNFSVPCVGKICVWGKFYLHCSRQCLCSLSRMLRERMTQRWLRCEGKSWKTWQNKSHWGN